MTHYRNFHVKLAMNLDDVGRNKAVRSTLESQVHALATLQPNLLFEAFRKKLLLCGLVGQSEWPPFR